MCRQAVLEAVRLGDVEGDLLAYDRSQHALSESAAECQIAVQQGWSTRHRLQYIGDFAQLGLHAVQQLPCTPLGVCRMDRRNASTHGKVPFIPGALLLDRF